MAQLVFEPVAGEILSGTYTLYDGALGTGGMLTLAEETLDKLASERGRQVSIHLFGQEINSETRPTARTGKTTWTKWAARKASATPGS